MLRNERFLAETEALLEASLDSASILDTLAKLAVPAIADWCVVHAVGERGEIATMAIHHADPERLAIARRMAERHPVDASRDTAIDAVLRGAPAALLPDVPDALLARAARDPEHLAYLRALGLRSAIVAPLAVRGRVLGAITIASAESGRRYGAADLAVVQDLARRAALAVDNARLFEAEQQARRTAEEAARHLRLLAEAGITLSSSLDYETTLQNVVRLALPALADFGFCDVVVAGGQVRRVARAHERPDVQAILEQTRWARSDLRDLNVCALSSGEPGIHPEIDGAWLARVAAGPEHLAMMRALGFRSMITVPLAIQGRTTGALTLFYAWSARRHTARELSLAEELARRAAVAVENARLYAAAQEAKRASEEASRLKEEFLGIVSHELRTPLTAILGWTQILASKADNPVTVRRGVKIMERNARAQVKIIEDILDVSRIVAGKLRLDMRPADLGAVARAALDALRPAADAKGVALDLAIEDPPVLVHGDPERLQQVLWNLVQNALKFTPAGGRVDLRLAGGAREAAVTVRDTGEGIAPEFLPHVFERFQQADSSTTRARGGLGLGLAIVRHVIEQHGGSIRATSDGIGRGATFHVVLPSLEASEGSRPERLTPHDVPAPLRRLDGLRVLVVDDEPDTRDLVATILTESGAEVCTAASAAEALRALGGFSPDVLLSDIAMPGEDGFTLLRQVRGRGGPPARVPAIALTAYARREDEARAHAAGFQTHLAKPVDPAKLTAVVASVCGRR